MAYKQDVKKCVKENLQKLELKKSMDLEDHLDKKS